MNNISAKYHLGDIFHRRGSRDAFGVVVVGVVHSSIEVSYVLRPYISECCATFELSESSLDFFYERCE